ncbi:MAG TPA: glycosyltransferase family 2 protein [Tepidisphaeraceae bacterium]|nr:glycosyltransferase family 2 protein [Tepidisphaeraceae bacterium]
MRILVVIVNYKTADLTIDALASIEGEVRSLGDVQVVVTDNASPDDSIAKIEHAITVRNWSSWCSLKRLERNGGFAYGNNEGVRPFLSRDEKPQYVWLLNPDTIARPGAIGTLVRHLDENPKVGIVGSRMENPDGSPQSSAFRFPSIASEFEHGAKLGIISKIFARYVVAPPPPTKIQQVEWLVGASMMIRREVFESIGFMDDSYFMYFEEVDFCRRARKAGWPCVYVPESRVVHLIGQSSGVTDKTKLNRRRPQYWFDSRRRYFVKNHGRLYALLADLAFAIGFSFWRIRRKLQRKPDQDPQKLLSDFIRNSALIRA